MTLQQLASLRRWHAEHRGRHPVELQALDAVLMLWVIGWAGIPVALLLNAAGGLLGCGAMLVTPALYVHLRRQLHRRGRLRCDWLGAARRD